MELQLARCAAGVDLLTQALKSDAIALQVADDLHQVRQRPAQPIQPPHHQGVAGAQSFAAVLQLDATGRLARGRLFIDRSTAGAGEGITLQVQILVIGGNTGVTDSFTHTF